MAEPTQTGDSATIMLAALAILSAVWAGLRWVFARGEAYNKLNSSLGEMKTRMDQMEGRMVESEKQASRRHLSMEGMIASLIHAHTGRKHVKPFSPDADE